VLPYAAVLTLGLFVFQTLMITAFFLNIAVPLTIGWWRPHYLAAEARADIAAIGLAARNYSSAW